MANETHDPFVAVDIGNSRIKFGLFDDRSAMPLPSPSRTLSLAGMNADLDQIEDWLRPRGVTNVTWCIASVNRSATARLLDWLREHDAEKRTRLLASFDLPLEIALERPDMVGIDRLAGAVAANILRSADRAMAVVDLGTAIKVDMIGQTGAFLGGAILPGIGTSARALHEFTDLLPLLNMESLTEPPPAIGASTLDAMRSGLYWGAIGAARELIDQFGRVQGQTPQVLLTGGAAASVAGLIASSAVYVPHLVLAGIALSAHTASDAG